MLFPFLLPFSISLDQLMSFLLVSKNSFMTKNVNHLSCNANETQYFIFLFGCVRSSLQYTGSSIFMVARKTLSCNMHSQSWHAGSSSLTRDRTQALSIRSSALATGPPRKSRNIVSYCCQFTMVFCLSVLY